MPTLTISTDQPDEITGPYGTARRIPPANYQDAPATLDAWIITAPGAHPMWSQYLLDMISVARIPDPAEARQYESGTTHQLLVIALNPQAGPYNAATVTTGDLGILTPINIAEQIVDTTDDQARQLTELCAAAVVEGLLPPETADAPERIRALWSTTIAQTLSHDSDPGHGRAN